MLFRNVNRIILENKHSNLGFVWFIYQNNLINIFIHFKIIECQSNVKRIMFCFIFKEEEGTKKITKKEENDKETINIPITVYNRRKNSSHWHYQSHGKLEMILGVLELEIDHCHITNFLIQFSWILSKRCTF